MHCSACGKYYRLTVYNRTCFCEECLVEQDELYTSKDDVGNEDFNNKSGKTMPVFYDDDDSHGF